MENSDKNIKRLFLVSEKNILSTCGSLDYSRITDTIIRLCDEIINNETSEETWWISGNYSSIDDLIVGSFWHYTEYHDGQYSKEYLALSRLGEIFDPNMSYPEKDNEIYLELNNLASNS